MDNISRGCRIERNKRRASGIACISDLFLKALAPFLNSLVRSQDNHTLYLM